MNKNMNQLLIGLVIVMTLGILFYFGSNKENMNDKTDINKFTKLPMEDFFRNPEKSSFNISPDGLQIAYMKPWEEGNRMMNIYVKAIDSDEEFRLTKASERSIYGFFG